MKRLTFPTPETYTPDQARVAQIAMTRGRGRIVGPLPALLTSPTVAEHMHLVGNYLGHHSTVPRDCVEIAILVTAKQRKADYAWGVHLPRAHEHGVPEAVTKALDAGLTPEFANEKQAIAYAVTVSLCEHTALSNALYAEAAAAFGDQGLVDLVSLVGFYHSVSMTLNVFGSPSASPKEI